MYIFNLIIIVWKKYRIIQLVYRREEKLQTQHKYHIDGHVKFYDGFESYRLINLLSKILLNVQIPKKKKSYNEFVDHIKILEIQ